LKIGIKRESNILKLIYVLLFLLGISALLLVLGAPSAQIVPSPDSRDPGGLAGFADLLKSSGYEVSATHVVPVDPLPDTLIICSRQPDPLRMNQLAGSWDDVKDYLVEHYRAGGSTLILDQPAASTYLRPATSSLKVNGITNQRLTLQVPNDYQVSDVRSNQAHKSFFYTLCKDSSDGRPSAEYLASITSESTGYYAWIPNGQTLLNQFVDKGDNALAVMEIIKTVYKGNKILFEEASYSQEEPLGLLDVLGPWARATWAECLLLGVVVIYSLGKRFGIPEEIRAYQSSSIELLNGISNVLQRSKSTKTALEKICELQDRRVRELMGISKLAPNSRRDELLPPSLKDAFAAALNALNTNPDPKILVGIVQRLESQVDLFVSQHRTSFYRPNVD